MRIAIIAATVAVLGIVLAAPVGADEDADFVDALRNAGFPIVGGGGPAIELGHWVCDNADAGVGPGELMYSLQESSARWAGTISPELFVRVAIANLCPQHIGMFP